MRQEDCKYFQTRPSSTGIIISSVRLILALVRVLGICRAVSINPLQSTGNSTEPAKDDKS